MRKAILGLFLAVSIPVFANDDPSLSTNKPLIFTNAHRIIFLADGSVAALYAGDEMPYERTPIFAFLSSVKGERYDRPIHLWNFIPAEIADGTAGQIYSVALSPDGAALALTAGWMGARDHRGHNGVLVLTWAPDRNVWRLKSWFDVEGAAIGDVAFGPGDVLLLTWHKQHAAPDALALFSWSGQRLGTFFPSTPHADPYAGAADTRYSRIVRTGNQSYVMYDSEAQKIRYFDLEEQSSQFRVKETHSTPTTFARNMNFFSFEARATGASFGKRVHSPDAAEGFDTITEVPIVGPQVQRKIPLFIPGVSTAR